MRNHHQVSLSLEIVEVQMTQYLGIRQISEVEESSKVENASDNFEEETHKVVHFCS